MDDYERFYYYYTRTYQMLKSVVGIWMLALIVIKDLLLHLSFKCLFGAVISYIFDVTATSITICFIILWTLIGIRPFLLCRPRYSPLDRILMYTPTIHRSNFKVCFTVRFQHWYTYETSLYSIHLTVYSILQDPADGINI